MTVFHSLFRRQLFSNSVLSKSFSSVKKSKSTDLRCPACKPSAVPPARYHPDLPIHACTDKKITAFLAAKGKIFKLESICFLEATSINSWFPALMNEI